MKVQNMRSPVGNCVPNQFILTLDDGTTMFQSYNAMIAHKKGKNEVVLDSYYWDYSRTTGKYRNMFLGENKSETQRKIKSGVYTLANLN